MALPARRVPPSASSSSSSQQQQQQQQRGGTGGAGGAGPSAAVPRGPTRLPSSRNLATSSSSSDGTLASSSGPGANLNKNATATGASGRMLREEEESHIQVAVRVRGRAPGEAAPSRPVLTTSGPRGQQLHVATEAPPVSSLSTLSSGGPASSIEPEPTGKIYTFDHVFGPEADQGMVYQNVVGPILDEVMAGYNCTIFAYGQTGTGKTHTMEGDLTPQTGTYSGEAGIIPRTLYRLFHTLELSKDEYSVHASFVELYNEEMRDLLASEPAAATATANGKPAAAPTELKIRDDVKGKGIVIFGLQDMPMKDAEHGLEMLRKGSRRRHIAATKCNEQSSRSHSIFTLTVHIKETTAKGEDVMRTGKLNLVDLAGSENIGRSGAQNTRAREAGMINQSLLALGRVINALVEKSVHVPYRESKLTRLLQESLGGRTKTCIIATVSTERDNIEETLSTLDYALRAKSIRNRPEVNQRMTRAGLIKEYVHEIDFLKRDLVAAREKNGIYVSAESWRALGVEQDERKKHIEELRRGTEVAESKMNSLREQFEQNMQLLVKREGEAKAARLECSAKTAELEKLIAQANELREALEEEVELREAYKRSERRLDTIASSLRETVEQTAGDVDGLFAKIDRKTKVEAANRTQAAEAQKTLQSQTKRLKSQVKEFQSSHQELVDRLQGSLRSYVEAETQGLSASKASIEERLVELGELADAIRCQQATSSEAVKSLADKAEAIRAAISHSTQQRAEALKRGAEELAEVVEQATNDNAEAVRRNLSGLSEAVGGIARATQEHVAAGQAGLEAISQSMQARAEAEAETLREHNEQLSRLLEEERSNSTTLREELTANIAKMLLGFTEARDRSLSTAIGQIKSANDVSAKRKAEELDVDGEKVRSLSSSLASHGEEVRSREKMARKARKRVEESVEATTRAVGDHMRSLKGGIAKSADDHVVEIQGACAEMAETCGAVREQARASAKAHDEALRRYTAHVDVSHDGMLKRLEGGLRSSKEVSTTVESMLEEQRQLSTSFATSASGALSGMSDSAKENLVSRFVSDVPTGSTPQKREWPAPTSWSLVPASRKRALAQHRQRTEAAEAAGVTSLSMVFSEREESEDGDAEERDEEEEEENEDGALLGGDDGLEGRGAWTGAPTSDEEAELGADRTVRGGGGGADEDRTVLFTAPTRSSSSASLVRSEALSRSADSLSSREGDAGSAPSARISDASNSSSGAGNKKVRKLPTPTPLREVPSNISSMPVINANPNAKAKPVVNANRTTKTTAAAAARRTTLTSARPK